MEKKSTICFLIFGFFAMVSLADYTRGQSPQFSNQTTSAQLTGSFGFQMPNFLAGGAVGDFNRDGWQDIFYPACNNGLDKLFINQGDDSFVDEAQAWGVALQHRSSAAAVADYDGDGWLDIYVTSLGPTSQTQTGHHKLYRNNGDGTFTDVAVAAGVNRSSVTEPDGWGAAWGDMDLDGDLDLAVSAWQSNDGNRLYRNDGDGTFTDVTISAGLGIGQGIAGFAPRFVDMNGDRYPEIIWIGDFADTIYYINDTDGTFTAITSGNGTGLDTTEMGATVADWDEDGDWDFYVTTIQSNNLYINQGNHQFQNQANQTGTVNTGWGWGTAAIDMNHDTRVDIVATAQNGRNYAFLNNSTSPLSFSEVGVSSGIGQSIDGRGLANFDFDNDGDQDIVVFPNSGTIQLWRNDLPAANNTNWLRVFLEKGSESDIAPDGVGSVVKVKIGARTLMGRVDAGSNYLSQSELSAHFGLGSNTIVDELTVEWTNGMTTTMDNVSANQTLTISPDMGCKLGDVNEDGNVNLLDVSPFVEALSNGTFICGADINEDGTVNLLDVAGFVELLSGN